MRSLLSPLLILLAIALGLVPLIAFVLQQGAAPWPDPYVWRVLRFTLLQASLSTLLSVLPAIFVARALARQEFPGRKLLLSLFAVPLSLPVIVAIFGLTSLYGAAGVFGGWITLYGLGGILLAHVFFNLPLATRLFLDALESAAPESHRLGAQLGFRDAAVFHHIDAPLLLQVLPRVAALVFLLCTASFVIVLVLGGPAATTLEVAIYQSLRMDFDVSRALSLSVIQISLSAVLVLLAAKAIYQPDAAAAIRLKLQRFDGTSTLSKSRDALTIALAALLVVPVLLAIVTQGIWHVAISTLLLRALLTSLVIALLSCAVAVPLAWGLAAAQARLPRWQGALSSIGLAGYIVPPAVLATGWFLAFRGVDGGLWLAGLLIAAMNALVALPFMLTSLAPAMATAFAQHDKLCAQLGISGWQRMRLIDVPSLRNPLAQAALMGFVLSMGDLTAVTLLGTQGLVTLPSLVQQQMGHYQSDAAGGTALILAGICLALSFAAQRVRQWT